MRLLRYLGALMIVALAATGIAIAAGGGTPKTDPAQATFTAQPDASKTKTRTCTGADGTYHETNGFYTGTSVSSDPRLAGNIVLRTHTLVNITSGLGTTVGNVKLKGLNGNHSEARLWAVNTHSGKLDGFVVGNGHGAGKGNNAKLFANFSATFNNDGSQLTGELGQEVPVAPNNSAVFQTGKCGAPTPHKHH